MLVPRYNPNSSPTPWVLWNYQNGYQTLISKVIISQIPKHYTTIAKTLLNSTVGHVPLNQSEHRNDHEENQY